MITVSDSGRVSDRDLERTPSSESGPETSLWLVTELLTRTVPTVATGAGAGADVAVVDVAGTGAIGGVPGRRIGKSGCDGPQPFVGRT